MQGIDDFLKQAAAIPGALGANLVDYTNGLTLGGAGKDSRDQHDAVAAADATDVIRATVEGITFTSPENDDALEDILVSTSRRYHLLRFVEIASGTRLFCHCRLDRDEANLAVARHQLRLITRTPVSP